MESACKHFLERYMVDDDDKTRRNLPVLSGVAMLSAYLEVPGALPERGFSSKNWVTLPASQHPISSDRQTSQTRSSTFALRDSPTTPAWRVCQVIECLAHGIRPILFDCITHFTGAVLGQKASENQAGCFIGVVAGGGTDPRKIAHVWMRGDG